jgi:predicted TIM-barrel fold metal-dependent hydrolase
MSLVLDAHGHLGSWADFLIPAPGARDLVNLADRLGVTAIGVSDLLAVGADAPAGNRRALEAAAGSPGRLGVWLVANPHQPFDVGLLEHPAVWGVKLHPDVHRCALTDPRYERVFELGVPVLAHGQTGTPWSDPALFAEAGRRYPGIPLLMGHTGLFADGFHRAARLVADVPSVYLEICGSRMTGRWVARLVDMVGRGRVVFGSDACFLDLRIGLGRVLFAPLADDDRAAVLGGTLRALLAPRWSPP